MSISMNLVMRVPKWRLAVGKWVALTFVGLPWSLGIVSEAWADEKLNCIADWIVKGVVKSASVERDHASDQ